MEEIKLKRISYILIIVLSLGLLSGCSSDSGGETKDTQNGYQWGVKNIELIVPANAGGDTDFNARTMAKYFEEITGVKMIVTNMAGAGGSVATSHVKESKPNGEIMLFSHIGQLVVNEVSGLTDYGYKDFDIVSIPAVDKGSVFVINKDLNVSSMEELIEKSKDMEIIYGAEFGSTTQLQGLVLEDRTGINLKIVDSGNAAERITELLGGRIHITSIPYGTIQDYIQTGDLIAIGQLSGEGNDLIENVGTLKEQGYDYDMEKPYILAYPEGIEEEILKEMEKVIEEIVKDKNYKKELETTYKQPVDYYNGEDAVELLGNILTEYSKYKDMLR